MRRDPRKQRLRNMMICAVRHQVGESGHEACLAVLRQQVSLEGVDDRGVAPFGTAGEFVEAGRRLLDLANALPGLLSGEAGELAIGVLVRRLVERVLAEDAEEPSLVHHRGEDQKSEMAFWTF